MLARAPGSNLALTEFVFGSPDMNLAAETRVCACNFPALFFLAEIRDLS